MVRWAGEHVDVYANKIRQLAGLAGFQGVGLERFTKLAFVIDFPNAISIELQQAPKIETLSMGDLLAQARVLTTGDQSQDVATTVSSPHSGIAPAAKSGSISVDATARVTLQKTAGSVGHVSSAVRLDTGPRTVWETKQGTRHQHQPSLP